MNGYKVKMQILFYKNVQCTDRNISSYVEVIRQDFKQCFEGEKDTIYGFSFTISMKAYTLLK